MSRVRLLPVSPRQLVLVIVALAASVLVAVFTVPDSSRRTTEQGGTSTEPGTSLPTRKLLEPVSPSGRAEAADASSIAPEAAMADDAGASASVDERAVATGTVGAAPLGSSLAPPSIDARIVRSGTMELRVRRGSFEDAWGEVSAVAGTFGGTVGSASRSGAGDGPRVGTVTIRVPSARFDAVVARLRETPRTAVRRLDIASEDVTQEYVDVKSRLRHDRAVEARLLALLS